MTYSAKIDADAWLATQRALIVGGKWTAATARATHTAQAERAQTLEDYAEGWLRTRTNSRGDQLRPRTQDEYRRLLAGPLAPLTSIPVGSLTPSAVRTWRAEQLATGRKTQTSRAYGLLNAIARTAVEDGLLPLNPCTVKGGQSTYTGRVVTPPTDAELDAMVAAITPRFRAAVLIAAWGGLRFGELTELRRKDLTLTQGDDGSVALIRIRVARAVTHTSAGGFMVGGPKSSAGVRTVALPSHVYADVVTHLAEHVGRFPESLLFPARDGSGHLASSTFSKHWYPARAAAGRSDMPFHALRHYAGTAYAQTGATVRETMARLGHSSTTAAMRYQHATGRDDELAARMGRRSGTDRLTAQAITGRSQ
jgi:integrase